ncbi:MAG TPA: methyltransferase domain-containing protein [Acidimicrobiales bacterium]|jgi:SAM-dependent methyltransferase|nr:methyltransferase domain-containing protein [Acidimicrobiales bacterium]
MKGVDAATTVVSPARLNWGCGDHPEPGWVNSDLKDAPGIEISCDIRHGLPVDDATFDYVVSIHALPMIPYPHLVPVLQELRRVLRPGGVLRLGLPDVDRAIRAYQAADRSYFLVPDDDEASLGGKLIVQLLWYGWSVTLFTEDFALDLLRRAGFRDVRACNYRCTASEHADIVALDNRERESLFVEGTR